VNRLCRVRLPWPASVASLKNISSGEQLEIRVEGNDIVFDAKKGSVYQLVPITATH